MIWANDLMNLAVQLTLYSNTSLPDALNLSPSIISDYFKSKSFEEWRNSKVAEIKIQVGIAERLNNVIKSLNNIRR